MVLRSTLFLGMAKWLSSWSSPCECAKSLTKPNSGHGHCNVWHKSRHAVGGWCLLNEWMNTVSWLRYHRQGPNIMLSPIFLRTYDSLGTFIDGGINNEKRTARKSYPLETHTIIIWRPATNKYIQNMSSDDKCCEEK